MGTRSGRLLARRTATVLALLTVAVIGASGCFARQADQCEAELTRVVESVAGVASTTFECERQFEGGFEKGTVVLDVRTTGEGVAVMEEVLRAIATDPELDAEALYLDYVSVDGTVQVHPSDAGFKQGPHPWVSEIRDHYGIQPG